MGENVKNVFGLNICQVRQDAYPYRICFGPFSYRSSSTQQDNQPTRIYSNVCIDDISTQRAKFRLVDFRQVGRGRGFKGASRVVHGAS